MTAFFRQWALCGIIYGFLLGIHDGRLALWTDEDPQPIYTFSVSESSLPPADRLRLRRGIRLQGQKELYAALEDYL